MIPLQPQIYRWYYFVPPSCNNRNGELARSAYSSRIRKSEIGKNARSVRTIGWSRMFAVYFSGWNEWQVNETTISDVAQKEREAPHAILPYFVAAKRKPYVERESPGIDFKYTFSACRMKFNKYSFVSFIAHFSFQISLWKLKYMSSFQKNSKEKKKIEEKILIVKQIAGEKMFRRENRVQYPGF